ncbi:hypothetical protein HOY34_20360 [Xinfangfangia sp. D13-10-4-6]|uniref:hypothetical protein n=1 Tax=Pseudogemmobacter hezensis TaxID=2737662 RepID=UPI001556E99C|nr:hypothetical protein [Pseudogemmobacter hezensis]NPD17541.1 hypothetical protein [Pseudogemmobacter hezensis]
MQMVERNFPGIVMLARLNFDWLFTLGTIIAGLLAGAFLGSALMGHYSTVLPVIP